MNTRRDFLGCSAQFLLTGTLAMPLAASPLGMADARVLVGFPPGGTSDAVSRLLARRLNGTYASAVTVENKVGGGGQLAIQALRGSPNDGSALLLTPSSLLSISPFVYKSLPYSPLKDFSPVSLVCWFNHALAVGPAVPRGVQTIKDFLAWAGSNPEKAVYGSPGAGSMAHLVVALLSKLTGQPLAHRPYAGSAPGLVDLIHGTIAAMSSPVGDFLPHLQAGKLRLLAVSGSTRSPFIPDVPTYRQSGYPITVREWYGTFLPGGSSPEVLRHASRHVVSALAEPGLVKSLAQIGLEGQSSAPSELNAMLQADAAEWRRLIQLIGFTAES